MNTANNTPTNFPTGIPVSQQSYTNWDGTITATDIWTCEPRHADDVVSVCNWAAQNNFTVRPKGIAHNWSPLTIDPVQGSYKNTMLVDTTVSLNQLRFVPASGNNGPAVTVGTGATMGQLMDFLEKQSGGKGAASGYSFPHIPAPDHLTVGGVLAINGHGTAIRTAPIEDMAASYGSMSNRIISLTAVVTDPNGTSANQYSLKTFARGEIDTDAFLTQLGRAFIVEATLQVVDNYNLRCQSFMNIDKSVLFAAPTGTEPTPNSCTDFLNKSGRVEVIWFPFTDFPWLKVWTVSPTQPEGSKLVTGPNNYTFSDNLPDWVTALIKGLTTIPGLTVEFGKAMEKITRFGLEVTGTSDLWGASKNTLFYVKDTTLRVTANGYAVLMKRADVQQGIADFTTQFSTLLDEYRNKGLFGQYPVNAPLEIRITGLDAPNESPGMAGRPVISSLATDADTETKGWDVALWLDVLTLPGTAHAEAFYTDLEAWMLQHFQAPYAKVVPEWSKGWAYTPQNGPWSSDAFMQIVRNGFTQGRNADDNWAWQVDTMKRYDAHGLFFSPFTKQLFEE